MKFLSIFCIVLVSRSNHFSRILFDYYDEPVVEMRQLDPDPPNTRMSVRPEIPIMVAGEEVQKPVVMVSQVVFPKKKKKMLKHHNMPFMDYYRQVAGTMTPSSVQLAAKNPYYEPFLRGNPVVENYSNQDSSSATELTRFAEPWEYNNANLVI